MPRPSSMEPGIQVEIRVRGRLAPDRSAWFDGLAISHLPGSETRLSGPLPDQAALYGVLIRIRDMGLELLSLHRGEPNHDPG